MLKKQKIGSILCARRDVMNVSYKKFWKLLIDESLSATDIRNKTGLSTCTISKLKHDEPVSITVLLRIATVLNCDISDICEFYTVEEER